MFNRAIAVWRSAVERCTNFPESCSNRFSAVPSNRCRIRLLPERFATLP